MDLDCKRVIENLSLHSNPDLSNHERAEFKKHLVNCQACQKEYEAMLHTGGSSRKPSCSGSASRSRWEDSSTDYPGTPAASIGFLC